MREAVNVLLVGAGGFVGAGARYVVSGACHRLAPLTTFPIGTLVVNLAGCFLIGVLGGLSESRPVFGPGFRVFLFIGVLGGFTTFSTFAHETLALGRDAEFPRAIANVATQVVGGLAAAWFGHALVRG